MHAVAPSPVEVDSLSAVVHELLVLEVDASVVVVSSVVLLEELSVGPAVPELLDVAVGLDVAGAPVLPSLEPVAAASSPPPQPAITPSNIEPNRVSMPVMIARRARVLLLSGACGDDGAPSDAGWHVELEVDRSVGAFSSVWGVDEDRLYVVGGQEPAEPGPTAGAMYRYDGVAWTAATLPADTPKLNWIYGIGDHRFAVGELGTVLHRVGDDEATPWDVTGCDTNLALWGVWGASADDVWTVGGDGFSRPPVVCHYDGEAWSVVELPPLSVMSRALFKVWGASADAVWAVGHRGLIVHWDGKAWTEQSSGTELDLISLWGTGADELLAVGGRSDAVVVRWDGAAWAAQAMPSAFGLNGIWMDDGGVATTVGSMGRIDTVAAGTLSLVAESSPTSLGLHAVFGAPSGRRFAVGGSLDLSPPWDGVVVSR